MTDPKDYPVSLKGAADKLGVTANAVRRLVAGGQLAAAKFGPLRELRFRAEDLDEFAQSADADVLHRRLLSSAKQIQSHYDRITPTTES